MTPTPPWQVATTTTILKVVLLQKVLMNLTDLWILCEPCLLTLVYLYEEWFVINTHKSFETQKRATRGNRKKKRQK